MANRGLFEVMSSRPHATMKHRPSVQVAAHLSIAEAGRIFGEPLRPSAEDRREIMKVIVLLHG